MLNDVFGFTWFPLTGFSLTQSQVKKEGARGDRGRWSHSLSLLSLGYRGRMMDNIHAFVVIQMLYALASGTRNNTNKDLFTFQFGGRGRYIKGAKGKERWQHYSYLPARWHIFKHSWGITRLFNFTVFGSATQSQYPLMLLFAIPSFPSPAKFMLKSVSPPFPFFHPVIARVIVREFLR